MKKDIETRKDIDLLMKEFYTRAIADEMIGYIFTDIARLDLEKHLPIIGDFWESLLLGGKNYQMHGRNPLQIHGELNEKTPLRSEHFRRWLKIFFETVDENFSGTRAEFAKSRAEAIANRMMNFIRKVPDASFIKQENLVTLNRNRE
jgi:hemoglobin